MPKLRKKSTRKSTYNLICTLEDMENRLTENAKHDVLDYVKQLQKIVNGRRKKDITLRLCKAQDRRAYLRLNVGETYLNVIVDTYGYSYYGIGFGSSETEKPRTIISAVLRKAKKEQAKRDKNAKMIADAKARTEKHLLPIKKLMEMLVPGVTIKESFSERYAEITVSKKMKNGKLVEAEISVNSKDELQIQLDAPNISANELIAIFSVL